MKRQKLWLSWLLSLCMVGTCAVAVACNNGGDSNEDSIGGSVSDSPSGDTTSGDTGNGNVGGDVTPDAHTHSVYTWTVETSPTDVLDGKLAGECDGCEETLSVVLPALNDFDYFVQEPSCSDYEPMRKYGVVVDKTGTISRGDGYGEYVWVASEEAPFYHRVEIQGEIRIMDKEAYPMNGRDSYASVIREFEGQESTCTQYGDGFFKCDCCDEFFPVRTYREHESCYTLTRINETEFTLAWECLNDCGEVGAEIVTLRTEENPEGRVIYTREGDGYCSDPICDYYAVYDEDGFVLADLKENVEEVPHSVIIDDKIYIMDKEMYPMNGRDSYESVITEFEDRKSTCTQNGDGFFKCVECCKNIKVITYREHYLRYTLARINETEFTLAWECLNDCGGVGAEIVTLRTEENPEGRVIYTRKGDGICCDPICDYYAVYDEDGRLLAGLEENVEEVPHSVIIDGKIYAMDKEMYPLDGEDSYAEVITEILGTEASYGQPGVGVFRCVVCAELFAVDTYREHEHKREYNTLTKVSETEFDFWWVCEKGGESGSTRLLLKTEEHPGGAVKYDGERYTVSYYGEVYVFSAEEVE